MRHLLLSGFQLMKLLLKMNRVVFHYLHLLILPRRDDGHSVVINKNAGDLEGNMKTLDFLKSRCRKRSKAKYVANGDSLKCQGIEILPLRIRLFSRFTKYINNS